MTPDRSPRANRASRWASVLLVGAPLCLAAATPPPPLPSGRPVTAVLELVPDPYVGLVPPKPDEVRALTQRLREELALTERVTLVDPSRLSLASEESGQRWDCDDADCAARIGRLVGARVVVTGRVVRAMTLLWGVLLHVTDVETGAFRRAEAAEFKGDYLVLRDVGMRRLARRLAGE